MPKVLAYYVGADEPVAGLIKGALLAVTPYVDAVGNVEYYTWVNQYDEELYLHAQEVTLYEQ